VYVLMALQFDLPISMLCEDAAIAGQYNSVERMSLDVINAAI
jgi:hypothetical protein